jgi:hypothetical protein
MTIVYYLGFLTLAFGTAVGIFFTLRAVKLI